MITLTSILKEELATIFSSLENQNAELDAILYLKATLLQFSTHKAIIVQSRDLNVINKVNVLFYNLYKVKGKLTYVGKTYKLEVTSKIDDILCEHDLFEMEENELLLRSDEDKQAFLRGAFLSTGSISDPLKKDNHFELYSQNSNIITLLQKILIYFGFNCKIAKKKGGFIVYLKNGNMIADLLPYLGSTTTYLNYAATIISNQAMANTSRVLNLDVINEMKYLTNQKRLKNIVFLLDKQNKSSLLDSSLHSLYVFIKEHDCDISYSQLALEFNKKYHVTLSKSGLIHRLNKMESMVK